MLGRYKYTASTLSYGEEIELVGRLHYFALIIPFSLTSTTVFLLGVTMNYSRAFAKYGTLVNVAIWLGYEFVLLVYLIIYIFIIEYIIIV